MRQPEGSAFSKAQRAAPISPTSSASMGGQAAARRNSPSMGASVTTHRASSAFCACAAAVQATSSSVAAPETLRENSNKARAESMRWVICSECSRTRPASRPVMTATTRNTSSARISCGSEIEKS